MKEEKSVKLSEIIFYNDENFYTIAVFESLEEQFVATGSMPSPKIGREYLLVGEWNVHPKYGEQFVFSSFMEQQPTTEEGILSFLSSGAIKGVGPVTAMEIVKKFGEDTLKIIRENPGRLREVKGIGLAKANQIAESYFAQQEYAEVMMQLSSFDISPSACMKLFKVYGSKAVSIVKENPYRLISEVYSIGFAKADDVASKMGFDKSSEYRLSSGIIYTLNQAALSGNTYLTKTVLLDNAAQILGIEREKISDCLYNMVMDNKVCAENLEGKDIVMLKKYYLAERHVASLLFNLCHYDLIPIATNYPRSIRANEKETGIELSEKQKEAVISSLQNGVSIITGGPGTGKTTIINTILSILNVANVKTALAAPTGRAAKRMEETTGQFASTIHRLLEYQYSDDGESMHFNRNAENPLDYDCIIIDEMSMVDILLMDGLLSAVKPGCRLILVGDADQLPPVGAGNVLKDMLGCGFIHSTRLKEIFRQAEESLIVVNAHLINRGEYPSYNEKDKDFFMIQRNSEQDILETIKDLCVRRLPSYLDDDDAVSKIQVLTPTRKGLLGSIELNKSLQEVLNPKAENKPEKSFAGRIYRLGDKVMQNKNDYDLAWKDLKDFETRYGVFNGDLGIIKSVDNDAGTVSVLFDNDRFVTYDYSNLDEIETAFAMTVHKSQGSEFPVVIMPQTRFPSMLATRNLLYTAVTRAKKLAVLVGNPQVVNAMVDNNTIEGRNSALAVRLNGLWGFTNEQGI